MSALYGALERKGLRQDAKSVGEKLVGKESGCRRKKLVRQSRWTAAGPTDWAVPSRLRDDWVER